MALALDDLVTWLGGLGLPGGPAVDANWMPDTPAVIVVVASAGGTVPILDGAFEKGNVHVRCRADSDQAAEAIALAIHKAIASTDGSFTMGTTYVMSLEPMGPPSFFARDQDNRTTYLLAATATTPT